MLGSYFLRMTTR